MIENWKLADPQPSTGPVWSPCYLNPERSNYTGVLKRMFGACAGPIFWGLTERRTVIWACEHHTRED